MNTATDTSSPTITASAGRLLFERFMGRYEHGQIEPLLELFSPEAEIVTFEGTFRGHRTIGEWFTQCLATEGPSVLVSTDHFAEDGDVVRYEATMVSLDGVVRQVYGVLTIGDGRILAYLPGIIANQNGRSF